MQTKASLAEKIFTYAILIVFGALIVFPVLYIVTGSFKPNMEIFIEPSKLLPEKFTFDNYKQLFANSDFHVLRLILNSVMYSAWAIFNQLIVVSSGAYVFSRGDFPGKKIIFTMFTMLLFVSPGGIAIYCTFDIVRAVGLTPSLYTKMFLSLFGVPVTSYYMMKGYIDTLPRDLDESATIDGCGFVGIFFRIIFPLLKPILATTAIFTFQGSWNAYTDVLMWTSSRPLEWTLTVGVMSMRNSGDAAIGMGFTMAAAVISIIPVFVVYVMFNKFIVEGIAAGAVKG